jgi:YedE family putative selenium metabolism protein
VLALALWKFGNPPNMGFCTACFERDIAGALGLHAAPPVRLIRLEIIGVVLGAFLLALLRKEFKPASGSAPLSRFVMGAFMMIGALVFLGCPLRMWERIGAGDLNAVVGLLGLAAGVAGGAALLKFSFDPPAQKAQTGSEGFLFPLLAVGLLVLFVLQASGAIPAILKASEAGPGIMYPGSPKPPPHALAVPFVGGALIALGAGLLVGVVSQYTRFCSIGGIRHVILARNGALLGAGAALAVAYGAGVAIFGHFKLGFAGQPIAHTLQLWNFLGLALVGLTGTLLDGCPLRQLVRAGRWACSPGPASPTTSDWRPPQRACPRARRSP